MKSCARFEPTETTLVRHKVGNAPEHAETNFALVDHVGLVEQRILGLDTARVEDADGLFHASDGRADGLAQVSYIHQNYKRKLNIVFEIRSMKRLQLNRNRPNLGAI